MMRTLSNSKPRRHGWLMWENTVTTEMVGMENAVIQYTGAKVQGVDERPVDRRGVFWAVTRYRDLLERRIGVWEGGSARNLKRRCSGNAF